MDIEQRPARLDLMVTQAREKFLSQETYPGEEQDEPYCILHAATDVIGESRALTPVRDIFDYLSRTTQLSPLQMDLDAVVETFSWDDFLTETAVRILKAEVEQHFPELLEENSRRVDQYS